MSATYTQVGPAIADNLTSWSSGTSWSVNSFTPSNLSDVLVAYLNFRVSSGTAPTFTSITGAPVSSWKPLITTNGNGFDVELWWGVINSTAPSTPTVNISSATNATYGVAGFIEFHASAAGTWTPDTVTAQTNIVSGPTSGNYPSMTPTNTGELQLGGAAAASARAWGGSTSGYTYIHGGSYQVTYALSGPSPSAPAWTLSSASPAGFVQGALSVVPATSGFFEVM